MTSMCVCLATQSCPTLCNPMLGSSVHGDSPGKNTRITTVLINKMKPKRINLVYILLQLSFSKFWPRTHVCVEGLFHFH